MSSPDFFSDLVPRWLGNALPEFGGDVGGATILKQVNLDFCIDFRNPTGLISKTN